MCTTFNQNTQYKNIKTNKTFSCKISTCYKLLKTNSMYPDYNICTNVHVFYAYFFS